MSDVSNIIGDDKSGCTTPVAVNQRISKEKDVSVHIENGDSKKVEVTKADMEKELHELAKKPRCTADELKRVSYLVNQSSEVGNSFDTSSVLMSAVMSDNVEVVMALVERFRVLFYTRNQQQESLLHLACKSKSNLRYYYVARCPALLTGPDTSGTLPLHIASANNDIEFISWLFKCVLQPESIEDTLSMPYIEEEYTNETYSFYGNSIEHLKRFSSPSLEIAKNTKLLAVTVSKQTALHAAIQNGHHELLAVLLKVVVALPVKMNLSIIFDRKTFNNATPLDIAIFKRQPKCLTVLLEFLESNGLLQTLITDEEEHTLMDAVVSEDIEVFKVLLQFGFHRGIEKAISVASTRQTRAMLRLLMYYYTLLTQMKDTEAFVTARRDSMKVSRILWKGLLIEEIHPELLGDACKAISNSSSQPRHSSDMPLYTLNPVRCLAQECLEYFNGMDLAASSKPSSWYAITEVDLSDNNLSNVPPELFQLPNTHTLSLAQNALKTLPTSNSSKDTVYTSQRLKTLNLDCNQLQTIPEDMVFGFVNCLEELSIQMNQLDKLPPGIWIMPNLKKICLSENKLSQLHYFDHEKYFKNAKFSTKVVTNLTSGDMKDIKSRSVHKYLQRLRMFCRTLHKVEGEEFEESAFIQGVLLLHQQRLTQDKMGSLYSSKLYKLLYSSSENELLKTNAGKYSALRNLDLSHNKFSTFPRCIPCLAPHLQRLDMRSNLIEGLNLVHSLPPSIITALLGNNCIRTVWQPCSVLDELCMGPHMLLLPQTGIQHLCVRHNGLEHLTALHLNNNRLETLFGDFEDLYNLEQAQRTLGKVFPRLSILSLDHNNLKSLVYIHQLSSLNSLDLSFNTHLENLPLEFGVLSLSILKLDGLKLNGIPPNLSTLKLLKYLKNLLNDAKPYPHMKLVAVGNAGSGKTTLLQQLTKQGKKVRRRCHTIGDEMSASTETAGFVEWEYAPRSQKKVTFTTWDFGGQSEYFTVYQCFLTHRSLYLVVWNVADGEQGLRDLQPWLENIEARAPGSPVIVIGTHGDSAAHGSGAYEGLEKLFRELYIQYNASRFAYPLFIHQKCIIVSSFDSTQVSHLRKTIYEVATSYRPAAGLNYRKSSLPMLEDSVPYFYIQLHEIVKELAHKCCEDGVAPIYTDQEYRQAVQLQCEQLQQQGKPVNTSSEQVGFSTLQLHEASSFLHNDGMLFQYADTTKNEYFYCVNPQWLCMTLSRFAGERLKDSRFKNGFVYREEMREIFAIPFSGKNGRFVSELGKFMEKLEVILSLDADRILIPSFLPQMEDKACPIPQERERTTPGEKNEDISLSLISFALVTLEQRSLMRYYILPFIPHDFFPRLIARVTGSSVLKQFGSRLSNFIASEQGLEGTLSWLCWRNGVKCVWNQLEILTIAPVAITVAGTRVTYIISSLGPHKVERQHGIEINVIVLPQEIFNSKLDAIPVIASSLATWLLQQAMHYVESVFNDWYEAFGRSRGFELSLINSASPCPLCRSATVSNKAAQGSKEMEQYMFSSIYCARVVAENKELSCPVHGKVPMIDVAPDLMFYDCYPSLVVSSENVVAKQRIGDGGFGTVYSGAIISEERRTDIAIKEFSPQNVTEEDPECLAEQVAWEKYQNASQEARMMVRLNHENVLRLIGITLTPMRLLLELAPLGDLKTSVERFKSANTRFNRKTLKAIMTQIAGALHHLHSHSIIYQDLKPGNVLLWQFPKPETQWDTESAVHVKLADYGVSQLDSPQGVKGMQGTPSYLPPEVLLQGGQQSHNTKLDVYSFGMFLYFLFTFFNPFEKEMRSVAFLLEEGKRPEFSPEHHPSSLWMLELMCWCWSELPQHRPNFKEVLEVLRDDTLTQLISAIPITEGGEEVTTACTRLVEKKADRQSTFVYGSLDISSPLSSPPLLPQFPQVSVPQNRTCLEVWHGTDGGDVKILQYLLAGCIIEVNVATLKSYVSSICIADENENVWVATLGDGIHVFDANTKERLAQWQAKQANNYVHVLHYCSSHACVIALEDAHMHVFSSVVNTSEQNGASTVTLLYSVALSCQSTLAHISGQGGREEIWTATQRGTQIIVFNLNTRGVESVLDQSARGGFKLRVMEPLHEAGEEDYVAISDGQYLEKWSVLHRKKVLEIDCHEICTQFTEQKRHSTVVSLLALGGVLYTGTEGGIILVLSSSFSVLSTLHACLKLNRYLLGVKSAQNITLLSKQFSMANRRNMKRIKKTPSVDSNMGTQSASRASYSFTLPANITNRNIIISFGQYFGVSSKSPNRPPKLLLPAQPSSQAGTNEVLTSKTNKQSSHMLLWSAWNLEGQSYA